MRHPFQSVITRAACNLLALAAAAADQPDRPLETTVSDGEYEVHVEVRRRNQQGSAADRSAAQQEALHLTPLDWRILDRAAPEAVSMQALANRCGHEPDSYFQGRVRRLARAGRLLRDFDGYRLPG